MLVVLFFFLKDGDRIWAFFMRPFQRRAPRARPTRRRHEREGARRLRPRHGDRRAVDAVAIGIGLAILQVPLALPLSVIVFLGSFIPLVGATVAGILAALVALVANGPVVALIVVAIVIAVNQLEGDLLQPVVMAQSLKLHPLVILIALTAGTILGGIIGAVLAVPLTAVGWAIIKVWDGPDPSIDERKSLRRRRQRIRMPPRTPRSSRRAPPAEPRSPDVATTVRSAPMFTAATVSYAANCALGASVALRLIDTRNVRWVHHALYIATFALAAGAMSSASVGEPAPGQPRGGRARSRQPPCRSR